MTTQRRGGGRPRKFTEKIKGEIVSGMASGRTLADLCREHKIERSGVWRAREADPNFDAAFEAAGSTGVLAFLDKAREDLEGADGRDDILKCKELLRHAEWMAEKRLAMFQPATRVEARIDGPMVVGWQTIEGAATILSDDQVNGRARTLTTESRAALPAAE